MTEQEVEFQSCFGKFVETDLGCNINKISIELKNFPELDYTHLVSYLWIEYRGKIVGEYRLYFTLDGHVNDFDLIIY